MKSRVGKIVVAEAAKWEEEGLVDAQTAQRIRQRYASETANERRSWGFIVSCSVGALLVGLGIIALLAANWEFLTREMRSAVAVAPVAGCALAAYWAAVKKLRSRFFWETVGTLWFMATIAALLIVATTYQVSDNAPALILAMCALTLPIVFMTRSVLPTIAWLALPVIWFGMRCDRYAGFFGARDNAAVVKLFLGFAGMEILGAIAVLRTVLASEYKPLSALVQVGTAMIALFALVQTSFQFVFAMHDGGTNTGDVFLILVLMLGVCGFHHFGTMVRWPAFQFGTRLLGAWAFCSIPITALQQDLWKMFSSGWNGSVALCMLAPLAFWGLPAILLALMCGRERSKILCAIPVLYLLVGFVFNPDAATLIAYVLALLWSVWTFMKGVGSDGLGTMNLGIIATLYLILAKFLASDASFTLKGLILIASGVALTAANVYLLRRRRITKEAAA